jgi:hypothetical protein
VVTLYGTPGCFAACPKNDISFPVACERQFIPIEFELQCSALSGFLEADVSLLPYVLWELNYCSANGIGMFGLETSPFEAEFILRSCQMLS